MIRSLSGGLRDSPRIVLFRGRGFEIASGGIQFRILEMMGLSHRARGRLCSAQRRRRRLFAQSVGSNMDRWQKIGRRCGCRSRLLNSVGLRDRFQREADNYRKNDPGQAQHTRSNG